METRFELQSAVELKKLHLAYQAFVFKKRKAWTITCFVAGGAFLAMFLFLVVLAVCIGWPQDIQLATRIVLLLVFALLVGILMFCAPAYNAYRTAQTAYKAHMASKLPMQTFYRVSDEGIEWGSEQSSNRIRWEQVTSGYLYKGKAVLFFGSTVMALDPGTVVQRKPRRTGAVYQHKGALKIKGGV